MSTDTAFALGALALVGPRLLDRLRVFLLTMVVVDDIVGLVVIALVYTEKLPLAPLAAALAPFAAILALRQRRLRIGPLYALLGLVAWVGLRQVRRRPGRRRARDGPARVRLPGAALDLERATERFREFREQPTAELARSATAELAARPRGTSGCSSSTTRGRAT